MSSPKRVPVVGVIGGIGSGKTALSLGLAERLNVLIIGADELGHAALRDVTVKARITSAFGPTILDSQGEIDRSRLARIVFGEHPDMVLRRQQLESIVHPWIRQSVQARIESANSSAEENDGPELILLDAAVLVEAGWKDVCDALVFVDTPEATRIDRVQDRGWSLSDLRRREASQLPITQKKQLADFLVRNDADLKMAVDGMESALRSFLTQFHSSSSHFGSTSSS